MRNDFLNEKDALNYFVDRCGFTNEWRALSTMNIMKIHPGRKFVMFIKLGEVVKIHGIYNTTAVGMDSAGVYADIQNMKTKAVTRVTHHPTPLSADTTSKVLLAMPLRCEMQRTLKNLHGRIIESVCAGILVKQDANAHCAVPPATTILLPYTIFKQRTGRAISDLENE